MFIVFSFAYGLAIFLLVLMAAMRWSGRALGDAVFQRLRNLLGVFVVSAFYFVMVYHLTNLYITERHGIEAFILRDGGVYTTLFWLGQIVVGSVVPFAILFSRLGRSRALVAVAAVLVVLGGLAQMYVTIIGGQAYPIPLFADKDILESSFFDGQVAGYAPSLWEVLLGVSGLGIALIATTFAVKVLPFLPQSLADADADPHYKAESAKAATA